MENRTFAEIKVGDSAYIEKTLTDEDIKSFVHRADSAMYTSKRKGGNSISFEPALSEPVK